MKRLVVVAMLTAFLPLLACTTGGAPSQRASARTDSEENPLFSLTLMRQGSVLLQQERYREALKRFSEANRLAPGNATVYNMIGLCHMKLGEYEQALEQFDRSLDTIPNFTDARNNRGATYLALGQYRLAEIDFLAVLADSVYAHRWEVHYNLGLAQLNQDELAAAEENFRRASTAPAPVFNAFLRLAEIAEEKGNIDSAVRILEDADLRFPERMEAPLALGRLMLLLDRSDEARKYLEEVISARPGSEMAKTAQTLLEQI